MKSPQSPRSHKSLTGLKTFYFGAPYYPEHWNDEDRAEDPKRMAAAGFNIVRMTEFAWDLMEPEEGRFDFSFFDFHIDRMAKAGIQSMLCTPTATPPAWLTTAHPEVFRVSADLRPMQHGSRQQACHSSKLFREYSRKITAAMAKHYKKNPHVVGWQTDNELFCHFSECHCKNCTTAFRVFLKEKYGDLKELNRRWGTAFWSQTYTSFDQIPLPIAHRPTYSNPSQELDYHLFLSTEVTAFQDEQVDILKAENPEWWITHNGVMSNIDYRQFTRKLDFFGVDIYPMFSPSAPRASWTARALDVTRSFSGNFIVPELQSGPGGQGDFLIDTPQPGEIRSFAYHCIARGADGILHFRWRTCRFGAEQYWVGILDHDNIGRRRYTEVSQEGAEFKKIGAEILGTHLEPEVGILYDSGLVDFGHFPITCGLPFPRKLAETLWQPWWEGGYSVGFVHPEDDLTGFKLLVMPSWSIITPAVAKALEKFVEAGGTLIITARSGVRNEDSHVLSITPPGLLAPVSGCLVEEAMRVNEPKVHANAFSVGKIKFTQGPFMEILKPTSGEVIGSWESGFMAGQPAAVKNKFGRGQCIYLGTFPDESVAAQMPAAFANLAGVKPQIAGLPKDVSVSIRKDSEREWWFILNHNNHSVRVSGAPQGTEILSDKETKAGGDLELESYGVAIIRRKRG